MNILQALRNTSLKMKEYVDRHIVKLESGDVVVKESEHSSAADTATNAENAVNAEHATTAESATKATQDAEGNVIVETYETKSDASDKLDEAKEYTDVSIAAIPLSTFVVTITYDEATDSYSADKTYNEINEAYLEGKSVIATCYGQTYYHGSDDLDGYVYFYNIAEFGNEGRYLSKFEINFMGGCRYIDLGTILVENSTDLTTTDKTIVGAINELDAELADISNGNATVSKAESATTAESATKAEQDGNGNVIADTYESKTDASAKLAEAKGYADTKIADLVNAAPETLDTLGELATAFEENQDVVEALDAAISNKKDKDLIINVTQSLSDDGTETYSSDKTFEEIKTAVDNGQTPIVQFLNQVFSLQFYRNGSSNFIFTNTALGSRFDRITIKNDNTVSYIIDSIEMQKNKVYEGLSSESTIQQYPSAKAVVDYAVAKTDVDAEISAESENPVQNKVVKEYVDNSITTLSDSAVLTTEQTLTDEQKAQARANISKYNWRTFSDSWGTYTYAIDENKIDYNIVQTVTNTSGNGTINALEDIASLIGFGFYSVAPSVDIPKYISSNYNALLNAGAITGGLTIYRSFDGNEDKDGKIFISSSTSYDSTHVYRVSNERNSLTTEVYYNENTNLITKWSCKYNSVTSLLKTSGAAADAKVVGDALALKADASSVLATANENSATESYSPAVDTDLATKAYTDDCENRPKNYTILTDEINDCEYVLRMRGGRLITYCMLSSIAINAYPTKRVYSEGEALDLTGLTLTATYQDGTTKEITTGFTVDAQEVVNYGDTEIEINVTYTAYDVTCTASGSYSLDKIYSLTEISIMTDFEYIDNGDGTVTLTDWKGTLNGEPSTEVVVPDDPNIIM